MNMVAPVKKALDALIYLFVGPFTVIGTIPLLLMEVESDLGLFHFTSEITKDAGYLLMNLGAALAIWCAWLMHRQEGSPIPSLPAKALITTGPYALVRHPMMHSLLIVGVGELLVTGSLLMLIWLPVAMRAGVMFVSVYEEPVLLARYGEAYQAYCQKVPRWLPRGRRAQ